MTKKEQQTYEAAHEAYYGRSDKALLLIDSYLLQYPRGKYVSAALELRVKELRRLGRAEDAKITQAELDRLLTPPTPSSAVPADLIAYLKSSHRGGYRGQEELPADLPPDLIVVWYWVSGQQEISDLRLMDSGEAKEYAKEVVNHSSVILSEKLGRRVDPIKAKDVLKLWKWLNR